MPPGLLTVDAGTQDVVLRLRRGATVELTIVDLEGKPVAGADVAVSRYGSFRVGTSDAAGRVRIEGLGEDRRYVVRVRPPGARPGLAALALEAWSPDDRELRLPQAMPLRGVVVDAEGRAVPGAHVNAIGDDEARYGAPVAEDGTFSIPGVSRGPVRIRAVKDGLLSPVLSLPDGASDLRLLVREAASLRVVFRGWPQGLRHVQAVLQMPAFAYGGGATVVGPDGRATFRGLDPAARYVLYLRVGDGEDQQVAWAPDLEVGADPIVVPLRPAGRITGTVAFPSDAQLPTLVIEQEGVRVKAVADRTGRFTLTGLPQGTWTITARAAGERRQYTGAAEARTGASVRIVLK